MLCCGSAGSGQLGLGGIEEEQIFHLRPIKILSGDKIVSVGCGVYHTVVVNAEGHTLTFGSNDYGQLGHNKPQKRPECVDILESQCIEQVACGRAHSIVVNDNGIVFSWGDNSEGQLGRESIDFKSCLEPRIILSLRLKTVVQVACGYQHTMVLTSEGDLYSWGSNSEGQLGHGADVPSTNLPQRLKTLHGLPLVQIGAGRAHCFALTVSGALFGWGSNRFGQLGVSEDQSRASPTQCHLLRSQNIKYVCCGEEHTAALTKEGGVFTFGAGSHGQLGHNRCNGEVNPRQVTELMGSTVSQIACGRRHTLAYVPSTDRVYTFGLGASGQLGMGQSKNNLSPTPMDIPDRRTSSDCCNKIKSISAGGDQTFILFCQDGEGSVDHRVTPTDRRPLCLSVNNTHFYTTVQSSTKLPDKRIQFLETIFSSAACLNASFLSEGHHNCTFTNHGVDLDSARRWFDKLSDIHNYSITHTISTNLSNYLMGSLSQSPADLEAVRLYVLLPECYLMDNPSLFSDLIVPFGEALMNLNHGASKLIERWWSKLPSSRFARVLKVYKDIIQHVVSLPNARTASEGTTRKRAVHVALKLLEKLNQVNVQEDEIVPYYKFYVPGIQEKIDIRTEYIHWLHSRIMNTAQHDDIQFCNYPFVFDASAKTALLQTDAMLQMQLAMNAAHLRGEGPLWPIMNLAAPAASNPCLVLPVSRDNIRYTTLNALIAAEESALKKPLKVIFVGEDAVDAGGVETGGVRKEFFMLIMKEVLDPKFGMFLNYNETRTIWFNHASLEDVQMFFLIGELCGLAIYNFTIIDVNFPLVLYKKLLKRKTTLDDMKSLSPTICHSLQEVLSYEEDDFQDVFMLNFTATMDYFGEIKDIDLVPCGSEVPVTKENRRQYVDAYLNHIFHKSVENQFNAFNEGFHRVCGSSVLELFHPKELMIMICGKKEYDFVELENNTVYKGVFYPDHSTIRLFWEIIHEMTLEDKRKFLIFVTGNDRVPILGMKSLKFCLQSTNDVSYLPVAHTCFNLMDLPVYTNKTAFRNKLYQAIENCEGFTLA